MFTGHFLCTPHLTSKDTGQGRESSTQLLSKESMGNWLLFFFYRKVSGLCLFQHQKPPNTELFNKLSDLQETFARKKTQGSRFQSDSNRAFYYKGSFQLECWKSDNALRCKVIRAGWGCLWLDLIQLLEETSGAADTNSFHFLLFPPWVSLYIVCYSFMATVKQLLVLKKLLFPRGNLLLFPQQENKITK